MNKMLKIIQITVNLILLLTDSTWCNRYEKDSTVEFKLLSSRIGFQNLIDKEKLLSYLTSSGNYDQQIEQSQRHIIYKRESGRTKNTKNTSYTSTERYSTESFKPKNHESKAQNFTIYPRHVIKFELEDAKYNDDYEKLRAAKKMRIRRSLNDNVAITNFENLQTHNLFTKPHQIFKFVYSDAITTTSSVANSSNMNNETKSKREISSGDSTTSNSRKIKITHPLSSNKKTKQVSYEELSPKMQKIVESAIIHALSKGTANDGDYLKFYYGDKIIKVPVSLSKYITIVKEILSKDATNLPLFKKEEIKTETLVPKKSHANYKNYVKYETPKFATSETYANFVTPKINIITKLEDDNLSKILETKLQETSYLFSNTEDNKSNIKYLNPTSQGQSEHISQEKGLLRKEIPITEDFNESDMPNPFPIYPTSYIEYEDSRENKNIDLYNDKNYAFGYHVSDYKSGNNFGHTQIKNDKEIKGEYTILLPDGRIQTTKYFADDSGFHADVTYENVH